MHGKSSLNICIWLENTLVLDGYPKISREKSSCRPRPCDCCYKSKSGRDVVEEDESWHYSPGEDFTKSQLLKQFGELIRSHCLFHCMLSMASLLQCSWSGTENTVCLPSSVREIITSPINDAEALAIFKLNKVKLLKEKQTSLWR